MVPTTSSSSSQISAVPSLEAGLQHAAPVQAISSTTISKPKCEASGKPSVQMQNHSPTAAAQNPGVSSSANSPSFFDDFNQMMQQFTKLGADLQGKVDQYRQQHQAQQDNAQNLQQQLNTSQAQLADIEQQLQHKARQLDQSELAKVEAQVQLAQAEGQIVQLKVEHADKDKEHQEREQQAAQQVSKTREAFSRLAEWQDAYNRLDAEANSLRARLAQYESNPPPAPLPPTHVPATASGGAGPVVGIPAAVPSGSKVPPPGFGLSAPPPNGPGIYPPSHQQGPAGPHQLQPQRHATGPLGPGAPPAPLVPPEHIHQHQLGEKELLEVFSSMLPADPDKAVHFTDSEVAGVNVQLMPLNWEQHYRHRFGSMIDFLMRYSTVFGRRPDGAYFRHAAGHPLPPNASGPMGGIPLKPWVLFGAGGPRGSDSGSGFNAPPHGAPQPPMGPPASQQPQQASGPSSADSVVHMEVGGYPPNPRGPTQLPNQLPNPSQLLPAPWFPAPPFGPGPFAPMLGAGGDPSAASMPMHGMPLSMGMPVVCHPGAPLPLSMPLSMPLPMLPGMSPMMFQGVAGGPPGMHDMMGAPFAPPHMAGMSHGAGMPLGHHDQGGR